MCVARNFGVSEPEPSHSYTYQKAQKKILLKHKGCAHKRKVEVHQHQWKSLAIINYPLYVTNNLARNGKRGANEFSTNFGIRPLR